jgi:hypothetical protein
VGKVDGAELRTCQVDTLEVRAAQVIPRELSHGPDLSHARRQVESDALTAASGVVVPSMNVVHERFGVNDRRGAHG